MRNIRVKSHDATLFADNAPHYITFRFHFIRGSGNTSRTLASAGLLDLKIALQRSASSANITSKDERVGVDIKVSVIKFEFRKG